MSILISCADLIYFDLLKKLNNLDSRKNNIIKNKREEIKIQFRGWCHNDIFLKIIKDVDKELMIWLNDNSCPWDTYVFHKTALFGNLDNMK